MKNKNDFLPSEYKIPGGDSNYLKLSSEGEYRFRIMSSPVLGYEYWTQEGDKRTPHRIRMDESVETSVCDPKDLKHFWAMIIWNYEIEKAQILHITQKSIQKPLRALAKDEDWGSPVGEDGYDIVITRTGLTLNDTEYSVTPKPQKKLKEGIEQFVKDLKINLEALFTNDDPFKGDAISEKDMEEIEKEL